jgi:hypothetical protein
METLRTEGVKTFKHVNHHICQLLSSGASVMSAMAGAMKQMTKAAVVAE